MAVPALRMKIKTKKIVKTSHFNTLSSLKKGNKIKFCNAAIKFFVKNVLTFNYGEQMQLHFFTAVFLITVVMNCITVPPPFPSCSLLFAGVGHQACCDVIIFVLFSPRSS